MKVCGRDNRLVFMVMAACPERSGANWNNFGE